MKNITQFKKGLLASVALGLFATGTAAAQTAADTTVANIFTLNYDVSGVSQNEITNATGTVVDGVDTGATTFVVDRLVDLTVTNTSGTVTVVQGEQNAVATFTVTNDGNDTQDYFLSVIDDSGDDFDTTAVTITYPNPVSGQPDIVFDPADVTTYPTLAPDESLVVTVTRNIEDPTTLLLDGDEGVITLIADTRDEFGAEVFDDSDTANGGNNINEIDSVDTVLRDGSSTGEEVDNAGDDSAEGTFVIAITDVTGVKTVSIIDDDRVGDPGVTAPFDCATIPAGLPAAPTDEYAIPGACVEYRIRVTNDDIRAADNINISDTLPDELSFESAAIRGNFGGSAVIAPTAPIADCTGGACVVSLTGVSLAADDGDDTNNNSPFGVLVIRARLQ